MLIARSSSIVTSGKFIFTTGASFCGVIISLKVSDTRKLPSLAVTVKSRVPLKFAGGWPVKRLPSNNSHAGNAFPFASFAVKARLSPSTSLNVFAGTTKLTALSSATCTSLNAIEITGASFTGVIVKRNVSLAFNAPSDAVTAISTKPLKFIGGVPVNLVPSKVIQLGSALPLASAAVSTITLSTSTKLPAGKVILKLLSSATVASGSKVTSAGASFCGAMLKRKVSVI